MFAYDKKAAEPCKHLTKDHACNIHEQLTDKGFAGCVRYNCFGAGQRVTNELFAGKSWRDHPNEAQKMFDAYRVMHNVHEFLAMLEAARKLKLDSVQIKQVEVFQNELSPASAWTPATLAAFQSSGVFDEIRFFFRGLSDRA